MTEVAHIPTPLEGVHLRTLTEADDIELTIAKRAEPHPVPPNIEGAPEWDFFQRRRELIEADPAIEVMGIWSPDGLSGEAYLLPGQIDRRVYEIGYQVLPHMQGQGYATAAAQAIAIYARHGLGIDELQAKVETTNHASQRVMAKSGFQLFRELAGDILLFTHNEAELTTGAVPLR